MTVSKSCKTCDRRDWQICNVTGFYYEVERKFPNKSPCGIEYKCWVPRRGFFKRIRDWFMGCS